MFQELFTDEERGRAAARLDRRQFDWARYRREWEGNRPDWWIRLEDGVEWRRFDPYPHVETHPDTRSECGADLGKRVSAQVLIEGGSRQTWETPLTSGDADLITIEGS